MEKYMSNMRVILCANSTSKLIAPIKSRCLLIRVAAPNHEEVGHNQTDFFTRGRLTIHIDAEMPGICREERTLRPSPRSFRRNYRRLQWKPTKGDASVGSIKDAIVCLVLRQCQSLWDHFFCRPDLTGPLTIAKPDWETYCRKVADLIVQEQTPARVMEVRAKFYELLSHCIPPTIILKVSSRSILRLFVTNRRIDSRGACGWKSRRSH